ncbi:imidazole glycerol phosphate synthase subunit HisH [Elizabethkingia anophelis]|uniref:Imidazole glycerol phosphate synthase subunit HisH n=1 Tax=Elizabethkingia anophelis TaxID=1117645 RepID=A0AAE4T5N4_9FLAO|nr:imidazole glycerol phosphate synthase subunit HisH [Elizabethkingia anophelis]MCT3701864.1 imidazole glycerol phosphate synthase subunit HisH [Elizabethkingia anophelis]MCT3905156.1 imidazole glycerol phosphate synthase subunit HisH [Elizabethkingia anophelis]MCT3918632.1 imidazole glycerol phosphate synthase subunit HisH [Elizabethkingia anophelis]MCT3950986.1 imidazole glycerol phosphate synthase subunit HisH [Elizabethkingia anophelis]MCT3954529.1 imidazole glycerol phosphate synthase su
MIAIVKYNAGNVKSVYNAVTRLGYDAVITDDPELLKNADKVIFPGVGEASSAMKYLQERGLDKIIINLKQPVLGICLGQQLLCRYSEEGSVDCLGIFDAGVRKFPAEDIVPHMGWNTLTRLNSAIFNSIGEGEDVYYVHGYYCEISEDTAAVTNYILPFSASFQKENFYATQFHPEKSASTGEKILKNFLSL